MHPYDFSLPGPKARYVALTIACIVFVAGLFILWQGLVEAEVNRIRSGPAAAAPVSGSSLVPGLDPLEALLGIGGFGSIAAILASGLAIWFQGRIVRISRQERAAALRDHHTGLFTRQVFMRAVRHGTAPDCREAKAFGIVALVSIDRFARLVEDHGIAVADNVAISVAGALKRLDLPDTLLCRFGESSFAIAVAGQPAYRTGAVLGTICERIREDVARSRRVATSVTVSVGVSSLPGTDAETRLQTAIVLNARASDAGGNRVRADGPADVPGPHTIASPASA
jgi:diguanylate cyclase (GGDEF)-like protein